MNVHVRFSRCYTWIFALSVCFSGTCALLGNELFLNERPFNTVFSHDIDRGNLIDNNNGESRLLVRGDEKERFTSVAEEDKNCTKRSIDDFPRDLFTYEQRRCGALVLHAFLGFYCFVLTATVCHDYLLPALNYICIAMNISTDVAGATFLAMASSLPEMFVNVVGTFLTESDLGVGTVIGSAVFDTFATPACGALLAFHSIPLEWRILSRDCLMYVISVGTLVIVMWDGWIVWYEASILLAILVIYLILLFSGKRIALCCGKLGCLCFGSRTGSSATLSSVEEKSSREGSFNPSSYRCSNETLETVDNSNNLDESQRQRKDNSKQDPESLANSEEKKKPKNLFAWPREKTNTAKCWFVLTWPLNFLLYVTIPDSRCERLKNWYPLTFVMCVVWIAISSYLVSWMMTVIGDAIGIPDSIMGITFLAAGGNMPEIASIVVLAKQGDGNMAMSNTLGANILDILLCLGLPWTIKCLMTKSNVRIDSGALSYSVLSIIGCVAVLYAVIAFFGFKLNKKVGLICLLLYTIFLVFAILVEMNVFFFVNQPMCDY